MVSRIILMMMTMMIITAKGQNCHTGGKVYFQAWKKATDSNIKGDKVLVFEHTNSNRCNAYNTRTGKFTAPRDGPYVFTWTAVTRKGFSINVEIWHNRKWAGIAQADGSSGETNSSGSMTVVLDLKRGDEVFLTCDDWKPQDKRQLHGSAHSTFAGWAL